MNYHKNFLTFNGNNIYFKMIDDQYWIAIPPICAALNIDADRSLKTLKKDPILGPARSIQTVQVPKNGQNQGRKMTCLPEKYIYGWIFSLRSDSTELTEFKKTCYELLYDHFHGVITNRKQLLIDRKDVDAKIASIKEELKEENEAYKTLTELEKIRKSLSTQLNSSDKDLIKQPELFDN